MKSGTLPNVLRCQTTRALVHHNALLDSDDDACPKKGTGGRGGGEGEGGALGEVGSSCCCTVSRCVGFVRVGVA